MNPSPLLLKYNNRYNKTRYIFLVLLYLLSSLTLLMIVASNSSKQHLQLFSYQRSMNHEEVIDESHTLKFSFSVPVRVVIQWGSQHVSNQKNEGTCKHAEQW
jgi:hypothetical protein